MTIDESANVFDGRTYNVLATALAVLGVLAGLVGAYYNRRALFPQKRRLDFTMTIPGSIIARAQERLGDVSVLLNGTPIDDPYICTLTIQSSGSHDIGTEQFDDSRPVTLDIRAEIVSLRRLDSESRSPRWSVEGTKVLLGPDLIRSGERMIFQILTVHNPSPLAIESFLRDTDVKLTLAKPQPDHTPADQIRERIRFYRTLKIVLWLLPVLILLACCVPSIFTAGK